MSTNYNCYRAFKDYLQGEKSTYPSSLTTDAIIRILQKYDSSYSSIFECKDITLLESIFNEFNSKIKTLDATEALKYGNNACRPALREYINFLSGKPYIPKSSPVAKSSSNTSRMHASIPLINGLDVLTRLTDADGGLKEHMLKNTFFFHPDIVKKDCNKMHIRDLIHGNVILGHKLPVRYSTKMEYYDDKGVRVLNGNEGKKKAVGCKNLWKYGEPYHTPQGRGCCVEVDVDGNAAIRDKTHDYTGHWVSSGKAINTISYYMISHIWGETYDPLFFSSLWNVAITPLYCAPILDKDDMVGDNIKDIKNTYKAISYYLYLASEYTADEINELFRNVDIDNPLDLPEDIKKYAKDCVDGKLGFNLQFLNELI